MGAGASMEEDYSHSHPPEPTDPQGSIVRHRPPSTRNASRANSRPLSRTGSNASSQWRAALRTASLSQSKLRKMRAAALGRKSACTVTIGKTGFSLQHIQICEGQVVSFQWSTDDSKGYNVTQVCHDGDQYKPVIGGFNSGPLSRRGFFEQQFNLEGEYKFVSAGIRCTPLTVEVYKKKDIEAELTDEGFSPQLIRIDQGSSIRWTWSGCSIPHSLVEVKYSHKTGTLVQKQDASRTIPTKANTCRKDFKNVGIYYFQTEGTAPGEMHTCVVHVRERQTEYRIEIQDRAFDAPILVIQEGDRVWLWWDKQKCRKLHCPYQIDLPPLNHPNDESYKPRKNGFKWPAPSKSGLLSQEFFEAGVYYFSDHNYEEAAEYIGTIIVKPKQKEHFIELSPEGFSPDLIYAESGDRVWWDWVTDNANVNFAIMEVEKCISPVGGRPAIENEAAGEGSYTDDALERLKIDAGLETVQLGSIGVYHYKVADNSGNMSTCSIISRGGSKNHTVHVTDTGFEPKVVTVHPGDRLWWIWQEGSKQHNIIQVSHNGNQIGGGFCSGAPLECPSAYTCQFRRPGVYYYISEALPKLFGAVVVTSQPTVHEVQVNTNSIVPDPLPININDVVAWTFKGLRQNDLKQVTTVDQVLDAQNQSPKISPPRRCLNRLFTEKGVYHFASKSLSPKQSGGRQPEFNDRRISSVLVDELSDSAVVRVDSRGFHPDVISIKRGMSILWTWKESGDEAHNIIHVNTPNSDAPLSAVQGSKSFNSGRPVPQNCFLYTFDDAGTFCVASQGAPGFAGSVNIIADEQRTEIPRISTDMTGGSVEKFHVVRLECNTPNSQIFFTIDGTAPELHKLSTKLYDPEQGVALKKSGLTFVRAVATCDGIMSSKIYTSNRFWVLSGEERSSPEPAPLPAPDNTDQFHWWNCVPQIRAVFTKPGEMEVFWESPPKESRFMLRGYQLFLNGVSYCDMIPPNLSSVTVAGMAGGRIYEVLLEAYPTDNMYLPHKSNKLMMNCVKTTDTSGPVISLETAEKDDTMVIVWMSISTDSQPIEGYRVYLNGQMCGNQVVPDANSDRCKVVIEGCQLDFVYRVVVAAVPSNGSNPKMSNEMEVTLPLDQRYIRLPPKELRSDDDDLYREYIEVHEDGSYEEESDNELGPRAMRMVADATAQQEPDSVQDSDTAPTTNKESRRNEVRADRDGEQAENSTDDDEGVKRNSRRRKKRRRGQRRQDKSSKRSSDISTPEQGYRDHDDSFPGASSEGPRALSTPKAGMVDEETMTEFSGEGWQTPHPPESAGGHTARSDGTTGSTRGRKRGSRTVMVPVTDTEHIQMPEPRPDPAEPSPGVTIGISNEHMPVPVVEVANDGVDSVVIQWKYSKSAEPLYRLLVNDINIAGPRFSRDVNSNLSYECLQEDESGTAVSAIQHCWKVLHGNQCTVKGLLPGVTYTIYVVAHYALAQSQQPCEIQAKSLPIKYTTLGPPPPPVFKIVSSDLNQVTLAWDLQGSHKEINVLGFQVLVDGQPLGGTLNKNVRQTVIDNLHPGHTVRVAVVTLTDHNVGNSEPSNVIKVTCPGKPPAPMVTQQPSYKKGSVIVSWERPLSAKQSSYGEEIVYYKIYVDGQYQGEVKATSTCDRNGYQYYLTDLRPGQSYDINMRSYAGQSKIDPTADQVFAICESELSNSVPVMCPAPPISPHLRLEGMHLDGIDVTWEMPQQYGDASVSGYQMLKDGKVYGSIIPPDVHSLRVKGLSLGDRVELQILALTDHPVGRGTDGATEGTIRTGDQGMTEVYLGDRYSACTPGPKLLVHYTGLVEPPARVWCEHITGHSAVMVWSIDQQPRPHFVPADSYQVTWWPGNKADNEVHSQQTKDDHLEITGLRPNATYNVVVEARKLQKYAEIDESGRQQEDYLSTFILTAKSDSLSVTTASPPQPPSNLGVIATTCHSIQLSWDPPQEKGVDIIGIRVDAVSVKNDNQLKHSCVEVVPSATSAVVDNLSEKSEYLISVTTITEEYFEQLPPGHELKSTKIIPKNRSPKEDIWLPSTSIIAMTSGTDAPSDVQVVRTTVDCVSLKWKPATVYGSNRLQGTVVRWAEGRFRPQFRDESGMANHRSMMADSNEITIQDLQPGILYKFVVEAVVSVKTTLESQSRDPEYEKQNRRTTHVMSRPVLVRTRAPCEPPRPIVTGYTTNTIQLYWEKPLLYSVIGRDLQDNPKYLKLSLEGYRLMINDKPHMRLSSSAQSCTLIKCKPGKTYKIVLIACTCTEEVKRERRKKMKGTMSSSIGLDESFTTIGTNKTWETVADDFENDESPSVPIEVTIPNMHDGFLSEINAAYLMPATNLDAPKSHDDFGDVQLDWALQGVSDIVKQFNMSWTCEKDGSTQKKVMDPDQRHCVTPVSKRKCVYDVVLDADYNRDVSKPFVQKVQVLIPGSPDAPEIWTKSVDDKEFIIEWGQPRCYGVKISGYQVYLNGKKVGNQLSSHHRKAVVPCKPKRQYRVNLVALSADKRFPDSEMSNTLMINTGSMYASALLNTTTISDQYPAGEDDDMMLRAVRVTEATIHLDWSQYTEVQGMMYYRVKWSSVAQPAEREVKLPAGEKSCVIHKCYPGTNHFVRLYAMGEGDMILDKSRQLTVQTSAPPDSPNVLVRACNFKYIAVQWDKPACYGDAAITGYKIYVNGVVEALLGPDQFTFTFTHGQWCREYVFQVQALTAVEKLGSKPSEPLVVLWPGIQPPVLRRAPAVSSNTVKVTWDHPSTTDGVQVKQYKVVVLDEATERAIQIISPIHPHSNEAEIQNLKQGSYLVYLEVHVHGSTDVVKSAALHIQPCLTPDPPHINVTVIGLEERRAIEKITCDLVNKRDRLLNVLGSRELPGSPRYNGDEQALAQAAETLTQVEDMLDDCLQSLEHYTGHLLAHVSWTSPQSNPDMQVSGYKVLVDGKQYGTTLHAGIKSVRVKLGLEEVSHKISMVSVVDHPHTISVQSNSVEVMTEPFLPFSFYSFFGQVKTKKSPGPYYRDALGIERKQLRRPINQGLLKRQVPPPSCTLLDIVEGEYRPLFPPSGPKAPTAILFWSKWCPYSTKTLSWFVRFARQHSSQFEFMAVACEPGEITADIRQDLLKSITENGWREDNCIRHVISQALAETTLQSPDRKEKVTSTDITELFGVIGVPTLLIVHPQDYIAWKGRYCAFDYASFEHFISFVFSQTLGRSLPHPDPWDANIDKDALNGATKRRYNEKDMLIHRPTNGHSTAKTNFGGAHTTIHLNGSSTSQRPVSAKKLFYKSKKDDQITVNMRPYSATMESPYSQKLTHSSPPRRARSGRSSKSKTKY